ncbi:MAG: TfoX/Sxy family DNA transformation protein, partial [Candidatus Thiodiazotropha sp.]
MGELSNLKGIGPKSEKCLIEVGIRTEQQLREVGAIRAFIKLKEECSTAPSLNFLYALARMFHPFLNLAGDMAKLGWFALTGNQTS